MLRRHIARGEDIELLHRDEALLVVNKPAGEVVHQGWARDPDPLVRQLTRRLGIALYPVHRLDRGTSGCLLFALCSEMAASLQLALQEGAVEKRYRALVRGVLPGPVDLDHPIPRREGGPRVPAATHFRPLFNLGRYSWVEALPRTGRLHQVRRHLKHLSLPIIGDVRYGKGEHNRLFREQYGLLRLALHARALRLLHPGTGRLLEVCAPLPADLAGPLSLWGGAAWQAAEDG